ncbi:hypothetical protein Bca52824_050403 [Brassica carinata]|uniref:Uncharacterized protein n=1 Tax=Brassica carinata TaxID=52824 RepID=A0A8X7RS79_BRACI|nr:hypothetical protein Bca52824_050403 [Brassica carinata]
MGTSASRLASVYGNQMVRIRSISSVVNRPSLACNPSLFSPFALYSTAIDRMSSEQSLLRRKWWWNCLSKSLFKQLFCFILLLLRWEGANCYTRAEIDRLSPPALLKQFEEILASKPEDKNRLFAWDK